MKIHDYTFLESSEHPGCFVHGDGIGDPYEMEACALKLQCDALSSGYFCIAGLVENQGYGLYLVPSAKGIEHVIREFDVGSHGDDEPESVFGEIRDANILNPLLPYFADPGGLKAKFSKPITDELLSTLEDNLYSAEAMMDDDEGTVAGYIKENRGVHLWWD